MAKQKIIKADVLFDGKGKSENKYIVVEGNKIVDVTSKKLKADHTGWVTPAFIDAHSHIGMDREGEPWTESETNDIINQILPLNNPIDSIYFDDRAFKDAVDFGVLYSCVVPGSGNLIGGQAMIIKNFGKNRDDAFMKEYGFKMALGYNPRSTTDWKGERSNTRMGVYALLEKKLDEILIKREKALVAKDKKNVELEAKYKKKKITKKDLKIDKMIVEREYELSFSPEDKALLTLLSGKYTSKVHVHKDDDVLYLIHLVKNIN